MPKRPDHPYTKYEGSLTWRRIDRALAELERNADLTNTTSRPLVIGSICQSVNRVRARGGTRPRPQRRP